MGTYSFQRPLGPPFWVKTPYQPAPIAPRIGLCVLAQLLDLGAVVGERLRVNQALCVQA